MAASLKKEIRKSIKETGRQKLPEAREPERIRDSGGRRKAGRQTYLENFIQSKI